MRDPFYMRLERVGAFLIVYVAHALVIISAGAVFGYFVGGADEAIRYAASWAVWGVVVRTVFVLQWHLGGEFPGAYVRLSQLRYP